MMQRSDMEFAVQKIREQYTEKKQDRLGELKSLDAKVKRPANVFAYVFGTVAAMVMGTGMSLVMTELGSLLGITEPLIPGVVIGVAGLAMALLTYPLYKGVLGARKGKYAGRILELSQELLEQ